MSVYLGLDSTAIKVYCAFFQFDPNASADASDTDWTVNYLNAHYNQYGSLAGWYIGDELPVSLPADQARDYYPGIVRSIKNHSSLRIAVSPYLEVGWSPSAAASAFSSFLTNTPGVDTLILQDGIGARASSYVTLGWKPDFPVGTGYSIGTYYTTIANAQATINGSQQSIGPAHLWAVHELFNAEFGVDAHGSGATQYGSASITRVNKQMALVPDSIVGKRLTWIHEYYASSAELVG